MRLAEAAFRFWYFRGHYTEGRGWLARLMERIERTCGGVRVPPAVRARAFFTAGALAWPQGDAQATLALHQEALLLARELGDRRLIALLGSTIGNLAPARRSRLLEALARALGGEDALLLGLDLVKDVARLEAAYNDAAGVTEAFVRNALTAVNAELGAGFDQRRFAYDARWDPGHEWMDIGLRARETHTVAIPGLELDVPFAEGEPLRVEISVKFRRERFEGEARAAGLGLESWWTDRAGDFVVALFQATREEQP